MLFRCYYASPPRGQVAGPEHDAHAALPDHLFDLEAAAEAAHLGGQRAVAEDPASEVDLMGRLVADVAVTGVEDPVPVVVESFSGYLGVGVGRWPAPDVEVDLAWNGVVPQLID